MVYGLLPALRSAAARAEAASSEAAEADAASETAAAARSSLRAWLAGVAARRSADDAPGDAEWARQLGLLEAAQAEEARLRELLESHPVGTGVGAMVHGAWSGLPS